MVKVKAQTKDLVVVDPESDENQWVQLSQGAILPSMVRVFKDHIEIDARVDCCVTARTKKKTWKFYYHDLLLMNETLYRIQHPQ